MTHTDSFLLQEFEWFLDDRTAMYADDFLALFKPGSVHLTCDAGLHFQLHGKENGGWRMVALAPGPIHPRGERRAIDIVAIPNSIDAAYTQSCMQLAWVQAALKPAYRGAINLIMELRQIHTTF